MKTTYREPGAKTRAERPFRYLAWGHTFQLSTEKESPVYMKQNDDIYIQLDTATLSWLSSSEKEVIVYPVDAEVVWSPIFE